MRGRVCNGRHRVFSRRIEEAIVIRIRRRRVRPVGQQYPLCGVAIHHHLCLRKAAEVGGIGVDGRDFALHRVPHRFGFELDVVALAGEQPEHRHLVVLVRRHVQALAIGAVGHQSLVQVRGREGHGDPRLARERLDEQ